MKNKSYLKDKIIVEAVENSIKHWEVDVYVPLVRGDKIVFDGWWVWKLTGEKIRLGMDDCDLCKAAAISPISPIQLYFGNYCKTCPYKIYFKIDCFNKKSHYRRFYDNPNKKNCLKMIKALKELL